MQNNYKSFWEFSFKILVEYYRIGGLFAIMFDFSNSAVKNMLYF